MSSEIAGYFGQIKLKDNTIHNIGSTVYGICTTAASVVEKTVDMTGFTLIKGATVHIKFTNSNTAENPTLNINNTGAKSIYKYGTTAPGITQETSWLEGAVLSFTYDGTSWIMGDWLNSNTIYESKPEAMNGTDLSLVTTGEKYLWNHATGGSGGGEGTITGIIMNNEVKGLSGIVDLGTVITEHQDISNKLSSSLKGANNGLAELDANGKVPTSQLPSYVDDVLEYTSKTNFPATGETEKIYVDTTANLTYRWGGTAYVEISPSLALGETSSTAYRGDRGSAAYAHSVTNKGSAFSNGLYKITTNSEGHVTAATAVTKNDITELGIPSQDTTYESKAAAQNGTAVSLVTTGEKYTWNNKGSGTITGITMNGTSKGSSGIVDLGTVITEHQDISSKADKNTTVTDVAYDLTNNKITKTINGVTSEVVTLTALKDGMSLDNVENKSSATIRGELTSSDVTTALGYTPPQTDTDTHRPIQVNDTQILGNNTTALNLKAGNNIAITNNSGAVTIAATDTTYESKNAVSEGTAVSLVTTGEKYIWNNKSDLTNIINGTGAGSAKMINATESSANSSFAEGNNTIASGGGSHAEGNSTTASNFNAHAEGYNTIASGSSAHAEGIGTVANHSSQHVFGQYNIIDTSTAEASNRGKYIEIVGNGFSTNRSNARTLDWNGNETLSGSLVLKSSTINLDSVPDEDITGTVGFYITDSNGQFITAKSAYQLTDGRVGTRWAAVYQKINGTLTSFTNNMSVDQNGAITYTFSSPDKFCHGLGIDHKAETPTIPTTMPTGIVSIEFINVTRVGEMIIIDGAITRDNTVVSSWTNIATNLPTAFIQNSKPIYSTIPSVTNNSVKPLLLRIPTTGTALQFTGGEANAATGNSVYRFNLCYATTTPALT